MNRGTEAGVEYKIRILKSTKLFAAAAQDDLAELARVGRTVAFQRNKPLLDAKAPQALVVQTGVCAELFRGESGHRILTAFKGPGSLAGLAAAVAGPSPRREIESVTNVTALAVPAADLLRVVRRDADLSAALAQELARDAEFLAQTYAGALQQPLEMRLAGFFAELCALSAAEDWTPEVDLGRLSQSFVAEMLGVSREHVNRTLAIWERSGLIFVNKKGDLIVHNPSRLTGLAGARPHDPDAEQTDDWLWEIDAHLDRGLNQTALHLALEALKRAPKDLNYAHRAVLATARLGAVSEALALLEKQKLGLDPSDEELASLRARLLRDLAFSRKEAPDKALLAKSAAHYETVFGETRGFYSGVNAAESYALAGDAERARTLAGAVAAALAEDDSEDGYWRRSTRAECKLIEGDKAAAASLFASACAASDATPGKRATTRRQLRRLADSVGVDAAWIDRVAPQPRVLYFCGPMAWRPVGDPSAPTDELTAALRAFLKKNPVGWAYGALASGADTAIAETLLEAGATLNVYLPLPPKDFVKESVHGEGWKERFAACMKKASSVEWNRRAHPCNAVYLLGAEIGMGKALRHAAQLETDAVGFFATQNGRTAENSHSIQNMEVWNARGLKHLEVRGDWAGRPSGQTLAEPEPATLYFALLAQDPDKDGAPTLPACDAHVRDDADRLDILLYARLDAAVAAAAELCARKEAATRRLWLDAGVFPMQQIGKDPAQAAVHLIAGANRPLTEPGKIYASDVFASAAALVTNLPARFEYAGFVPTREKLDPCAMYLVRF
jgi:CRP-like cAMP-binding protein